MGLFGSYLAVILGEKKYYTPFKVNLAIYNEKANCFSKETLVEEKLEHRTLETSPAFFDFSAKTEMVAQTSLSEYFKILARSTD